jgi:predicted TIM-barrel fold metal-dependent hydrolase
MSLEYRCISADCHIDLSWMPHDLFVSNASRALKDRMPYVTDGPDGPVWVTRRGAQLGAANSAGASGATSFAVRYVPGRDHRVDRMAETGLFEDARRGVFRPTTPELRLQDQERDGLQAEVLYGLLGMGRRFGDPEAAVEFHRIYNDWLSGFCSHDRKRFVGLASLPSDSVEAATREARRAATLGLGGLELPCSWEMEPLWSPYWEPLWQVAAEAGLAVHFHVYVPRPEPDPRGEIPAAFKEAKRAAQMSVISLPMAGVLASVIQGGALERHPGLRVVFGESGIGWIPFVLERMDHLFEERFNGRTPLKMKPSEYWRRQCRATFQSDRAGTKLLEELGVETVMWGSDYPHPDGVFPDSQEYIARQFGDLDPKIRRKIICDNAAQFYGLAA